MKRVIAPLFVAALVTLVSACAPNAIYHTTNHDEILLFVGDTIQLELSNIPEGKSAGDYAWRGGGDVEIAGNGAVTVLSAGWSSVDATLDIGNDHYWERFDLVIFEPGEFKMGQNSYVFALDDGVSGITVGRENANLPDGGKIQWHSSDPSIASVSPNDERNRLGKEAYALVQPNGPGTVTITASIADGRVQAECTVTVIGAREFTPQVHLSPSTVLLYISERADYYFEEYNGTAFVGSADTTIPEIPEGTAGGGGKYIVINDLGTLETTFTTAHSFEAASAGYSATANESLPIDGAGFTSLLPPGMRASTMDEVSYVIRITDGEPLYDGTYEQGVPGYRRVFEIRVEDALTGEVLEVLASINGRDLASHYYVSETDIPEALYGRLPDEWDMLDAIYKTLADFWLENYQSVVFYRGNSAMRYYGAGEIEIPATLGIENMYYNAQSTLGISSFILPAGIEIKFSPEWANAAFVVEAGSAAEAYCIEHDISYAYK